MGKFKIHLVKWFLKNYIIFSQKTSETLCNGSNIRKHIFSDEFGTICSNIMSSLKYAPITSVDEDAVRTFCTYKIEICNLEEYLIIGYNK